MLGPGLDGAGTGLDDAGARLDGAGTGLDDAGAGLDGAAAGLDDARTWLSGAGAGLDGTGARLEGAGARLNGAEQDRMVQGQANKELSVCGAAGLCVCVIPLPPGGVVLPTPGCRCAG